MKKQLVVYCTQNQSGAEELFASLRSRLPGVDFQLIPSGTSLLESLRQRTINPVAILMDFVFKSENWTDSLPGDIWTTKILNLRPDAVVIGYAQGMDSTPPDLGKTIQAAFEEMGAAACFDTAHRIEDLVEELTGWLKDDRAKTFGRKIAPFTYGATILYYLPTIWLITNRLDSFLSIVFNYWPVWVIIDLVGMVIYFKCDLPEEISTPLMIITLPPLFIMFLIFLGILAVTTGPGFGIAILAVFAILALSGK